MNNHPITFKYSFIVDLKTALHTVRDVRWLKENDLAYTLPSPFKMFSLWKSHPKNISLSASRPVVCYWVSSGTWGSYQTPDKIFICPFHIDKAGGLERVIQHEVLHLEQAEHVVGMSHEEKESFIEAKEQK